MDFGMSTVYSADLTRCIGDPIFTAIGCGFNVL
jgi:hypothetical protein